VRKNTLPAIVLLLALSAASRLAGSTIYYEAIDLPDQVVGEDRWRYNYLVAGIAFEADQGFTIFFDINLFRDLDISSHAVHDDWDVLVFQPDANLPADGVYDALALVSGASLQNPFSVDFVFLGSGRPGSQPFDITQFDSQGNFVGVLESGFTTAIPEPGPLSLTLLGLSAFVAGRFLKRRQRVR
jgi:hypothetical protein